MRGLVGCLLALSVVALGCGRRSGSRSSASLDYPETRTVDHVDTYHGKVVKDPYRWLEDLDAPETKAWIEAQNELTQEFLGRISARSRIRERLESLVNYERFGVPWKEGGRYFFTRNTGLQNQSVLYTVDELDAEPRVLLDPNFLSEDGTVSLAGQWVSPDGRYMAYGLSTSGSDWREIKVRDIDTGQDLAADHLKWIKFSGASWSADASGFYYDRLPQPESELGGADNRDRKVYFHEIGTPQSEDRLVYDPDDPPEIKTYSFLSDDKRYLGVWVSKVGTVNNGIRYRDLEGEAGFVDLLDSFDAKYEPIGSEGTTWFFVTNLGAPNRRIVAIDVENPAREHWREVVAADRYPIEDAWVVADRIVVHYLRRAQSQLEVFRFDGGREGPIPLPGVGSLGRFHGKYGENEAFLGFTGFTFPPTSYRYEFDTGKLITFRQPKVDFDPDDFVAKQVAYHSRDGTPITMFITHRKGLVLDGSNPALLYGYGGFNISLTPWFSMSRVVWMEMGGVWAMPNLRGGGEYGEAWHEGGMLKNKQNVFDDFIAAAEGLIHNKYTSSPKLAIAGGSNGGLLVGACMTQRPQLFGACLPDVGVMDMLRFHEFTVGEGWISEYGSSDDPEMFPILLRYSPYHNLREGVAYPATLIATADHDDRVVPSHSFKFAARLQAVHAGPAPVLIRIETSAGHGAGTPIAKILDEQADKYAFLAEVLDVDVDRRFWRD